MVATDWKAFVAEHGWHASVADLSAVLDVRAADVTRFRQAAKGVCTRLPHCLDFGELFSRRHGRPPADAEWPAPRRTGSRGDYTWQKPELALLATLVGTLGVREIAELLTVRLRRVTGDPDATRNVSSVQLAINNRLGLQAGSDLVGGLTTREAAKIAGRVSLIHQAIYSKRLRTFRVGKRHVIPRDEFERWMATREQPPEGWLRLASLRAPLGILSDKLPEYARLGYIPDVTLVQGITTARGVWYIHPDRHRQILADAAAGRPMPWHGKALLGNQKAMWAKWQRRKHLRCAKCASIWNGPTPKTFDDFCARYEALTLGQKRHLTVDLARVRKGSAGWRKRGSVRAAMRDAGLTVYEAARLLGQRSRWVRAWIRRGLLECGGIARDAKGGEAVRITPLGIEILRAAAKEDQAAAVRDGSALGLHEAAHHAGVSISTIQNWRQRGLLLTTDGPRGQLFDRAGLEACARKHWTWAVKRWKRAEPPAWIQQEPAA
jgi:hypothetical protein